MEVIPAIDLRAGACVRLFQGDFDRETVYGRDPAAMARRWRDRGARLLHLVDLDGAREGRPVNRQAIRAIAEAVDIPFEIGGGIRDLRAIEDYLSLGAARAIIGTAAVTEPQLLAEACRLFPGRVVLGLDARQGRVAVSGWLDTRAEKAVDLARSLVQEGLAAIIYTDISRDGTHAGLNLEATAEVCRAVAVPVVAAGGVSSLADIEAALGLAELGLWGVITGRAIYDGTLDLAEALRLARGGSESG